MARDPAQVLARRNRTAAGTIPKRPSWLRLWLRRRRGIWRPAGAALLGLSAVGFVGLAVVSFDPYGKVAALADSAADISGNAGLQVREVIVEGSRHTPPELMREALGLRQGDPILAFDPAAAKERLEDIAWVKRASVQRHLNGTIKVVIEERQPFAIWQKDWQKEQKFHLIDRAGDVVDGENIGAFGPLPLVVGPGAAQAAAPIIDLLKARPELQDRVHALVRVGERRWNLRLRNGTDVMLPENHEAAAIARLAELQAKQALLDRPVAVIDLRLPDKLVIKVATTPTPTDPPASQPQQPRPRSGRG